MHGSWLCKHVIYAVWVYVSGVARHTYPVGVTLNLWFGVARFIGIFFDDIFLPFSPGFCGVRFLLSHFFSFYSLYFIFSLFGIEFSGTGSAFTHRRQIYANALFRRHFDAVQQRNEKCHDLEFMNAKRRKKLYLQEKKIIQFFFVGLAGALMNDAIRVGDGGEKEQNIFRWQAEATVTIALILFTTIMWNAIFHFSCAMHKHICYGIAKTLRAYARQWAEQKLIVHQRLTQFNDVRDAERIGTRFYYLRICALNSFHSFE